MKKLKRIILIVLLMSGIHSWAQSQISGTVLFNGEPLPGVNVQVENSDQATATDFDGNFSLNLSSGQKLIFSYIGYKTKEIVYQGESDLTVTLEEGAESLDEIVLIGYGVQKKKDLTSAISIVDGKEIAKRNVTNIQESLSGQLPGVQVSSGGGAPGAESTVTIRGISTLNDNNPLYVVDDIPLSDINFLSPNDIESVQVLKDASAAAIYGSRASNGVIIIRTKQAKKGKVLVDINSYTGMQSVAKKPQLANASQYAQIINQALVNDGNAPLYPDPEAFGQGTDWWDAVTQKAPITDTNVGITAASEHIKISSGAGYQKQDGIVKGSDYQKWNVRLNTQYNLRDNFKITENFTFAQSTTNDGPGLVWDVHRLEPITNPYLPEYEQEGRNPYSIFSPTITDVPNALGQLSRASSETVYNRGIGSFGFDWTIADKVTISSKYNLYFSSYANDWFAPDYYIEENDKQILNSVGRTHNNRMNTTWNNIISYNDEFGKNSLGIMGGMILESQVHKTLSGQAEGTPSNHPDLRYLDAATEAYYTTGNNDSYSLMSFIGRMNYSFDSKYLLTATVRADGSSLFPDDHKWGVFPSVSAAWVISNESFLESSSLVSYSKLRFGWGQIGNDNRNSIPVSARITTLGNEYYTSGGDQNTLIGTAPDNVGNPDIKWETVEDLNLGLDMSFFNDSFGFNFDIYKRKTKDMLMAKSIPAYLGSGFNAQWANVGSFETKGFDLGLNYKQSWGDFNFGTTVNISKYTAKVLELADGEAIWDGNHQRLDLLSYTAEGQTPGLFYGYVSDGVFQNHTEVNSHSDQYGNIIQPFAQPGDLRFKDLNGDGILDNEDREVIGNPIPDFSFGINLKADYKGFDLSMLFTGTYGNDIMNAANPYLNTGQGNYNSYANLLTNAWNGEGSTNSQPRLTNDDPNQNFRYSDFYIEDGSYLRMRNLQAGYSLNTKILEKMHLTRLRIYTSWENVFTISNFSGLDPDVGGYATLQGVDWGHYPVPQVWNIGVNLSF